jgi:class 3 adenylate cyclase/pimeloyl-ACP methyl ester carboxylesterase
MEQPEIHFTTTPDDVTIAYWAIGEGAPLILIHNFGLSHAGMEWTVPSVAAFHHALADHHRLIRFDPRNGGMSSRGREIDMSLERMGADISVVADACGVDRFALFAVETMGPVAIDYAASNPERVSHLILCDTFPTTATSVHARWSEAQEALARADGGVGAAFFREFVPAEEVEAILALVSQARGRDLSINDWDAQDRLGEVRAPTLVLSSRQSRAAEPEDTRRLVGGIPSAQLRSFEGTILPYFTDQAPVVAAVDAFLGGASMRTTSVKGKRAERFGGVTTIVFTDLVASTELLARLGDVEGREAFRSVERTTADLAAGHHGEVIKYTGDGSLVAFDSTSEALAFSAALIHAMNDSPLQLRIGMAAGEPLRESGDLHGAVVHQASRVADQAGAGEIIVADSVRQLALGKGFSFEPAGEHILKGFDEPVRLWRVTAF